MKKSQKNNLRSSLWTALSKVRRKRTDFRAPWTPPMSEKHKQKHLFLHDFTYAPGAQYGSKMTSKMIPAGSLGGIFADKCTQKGLPKKLLKF